MLAHLPSLQNVTLKACPLAEQQGYQDSIIRLLPRLQILDSHKVSSAAMQAKQQTGSSIAKPPSAQRSALQPQEKLLLSNIIVEIDGARLPAKRDSAQANDRAAKSPQRQKLVSSGADEAAVMASRPVLKRKQIEQLDNAGTADAKAGCGPSHASNGAQEGKKAKQATRTGKGVHEVARDRQGASSRAVAGELGKKKPCRDATAAASGVQSQEDGIMKQGKRLSMNTAKDLGTGEKGLREQSMIAAKTARDKPSKKLRDPKGKASALVPSMPQAQASSTVQSASQALASGKQVAAPKSNSHHRV